MKHTLENGWVLEQNELLNNKDIKRIYSLREHKILEADLSMFETYYFDSVSGDDLNEGTKDKPFKNLSKINEILKKECHIAIFLRRNSKFNGNILIDREGGYSTYIGAYGEGELPLIKGEDSVVKICCSNTFIYDLEITGPKAYRGIHLLPSKPGVLENIVISSCYVHDINWTYVDEVDTSLMDPDTLDIEKITPEYEEDGVTKGRYFYRYYGGIIGHNEIGPSCFKNIWIVNNIVKNVSRTAITIYNKWTDKPGVGYGYNKFVSYDTPNDYETGVGYFVSENIYCLDNYLETVGADGIVISSAKNVLVKGNTCYFANYLGRKGYWNASIWVYNVDVCLFELNEAAYTYKRRGSEDGQGFDLDNCCVNTIFQNNYSHHNEGGGLLICNLATPVIKRDNLGNEILNNGEVVSEKITGKWFNNIIYNNYFLNNGQVIEPTRSAFLTIARESDYAYFDSNVVVLSGDIKEQSVINTEDQNTYCYHHIYVNNVFYSKTNNNAKFTINMMKDYKFFDNYFHNVQEIGNNKYQEVKFFDSELSFDNCSSIFDRAKAAKENLLMFEKINSKGDFVK